MSADAHTHNTTDYIFPLDWPGKSAEEKCRWYIEERAYRQARRQLTQTGWVLRYKPRYVYR